MIIVHRSSLRNFIFTLVLVFLGGKAFALKQPDLKESLTAREAFSSIDFAFIYDEVTKVTVTYAPIMKINQAIWMRCTRIASPNTIYRSPIYKSVNNLFMYNKYKGNVIKALKEMKNYCNNIEEFERRYVAMADDVLKRGVNPYSLDLAKYF